MGIFEKFKDSLWLHLFEVNDLDAYGYTWLKLAQVNSPSTSTALIRNWVRVCCHGRCHLFSFKCPAGTRRKHKNIEQLPGPEFTDLFDVALKNYSPRRELWFPDFRHSFLIWCVRLKQQQIARDVARISGEILCSDKRRLEWLGGSITRIDTYVVAFTKLLDYVCK